MELILTNHAFERWNERVASKGNLTSNKNRIEKLLTNGRVLKISSRSCKKGKQGYRIVLWISFPLGLKIKICIITDISKKVVVTLWPLTDVINQY